MTASPAGAPHAVLNALPMEAARQALASCCGARRWVAGMLARRPFASSEALHAAAAEVWQGLERADFLEAFAHHPRIGERADARAADAAAATGRAWSAEEQARAAAAPDEATRLRALNQEYAERFGYIFIICATGKSAAEILAALRARLPHDPEAELAIAAAEQAQITHLRLEKLAR
ncbi:MAG TPA: 2-oxo-4-hydroxy-4-carboxy-5-ureidoimidazoline decarboxylase [Polyangia bacterium]|jgi:2-oxo-4-hydroxy-4-carboxy-5-ureidoimidazoline decarboxylase|nr:2-oxo-4-hydroxy-4-carboxy-5-ureidoimidazoline decarboxylase [Polyangia bacterium]